MSPSQKGIVVQRGPIEIDVPRSAGYYGGIALAVGLGMIEWPIAVFIGAIPVIKMLSRQDMPRRIQFVSHVFDGAAKPVGGDAEGTIRLNRMPAAVSRVTRGQSPSAPRRRRSASGRTTASGSRRTSVASRTPTTAAVRRTRRRTASAATGDTGPGAG